MPPLPERPAFQARSIRRFLATTTSPVGKPPAARRPCTESCPTRTSTFAVTRAPNASTPIPEPVLAPAAQRQPDGSAVVQVARPAPKPVQHANGAPAAVHAPAAGRFSRRL